MTNEMKLLTALCDALGFDVERECVNAGVGGHLNPCETPIYEYKLAKRVSDVEVEWAKSAGILDENGEHKV